MYREHQVKAGMELLDKTDAGWIDRINLETLSIQSASRCTLGQAFGGFSAGLEKLQITHISAASYGFTLPHYRIEDVAAGIVSVGRMFRALNETWIALIQERRNTATSEQVEERELVLV